MNRSAIRIFIIASILAVLAILPGSASAAELEATAPTAPPVIDAPTYMITTPAGSMSKLRAGAVISHGVRLSDGSCSNGEIAVEISNRGAHEGVVSMSVDAHCNVRLDDLSWRRVQVPAAPSVAAASQNKRSASTKSELNDEVGMDLLVALAEIEYSDDGFELDDGEFDYDCRVHCPWWQLADCDDGSTVHGSDRMWGWTRVDGKAFPESRWTGTTHGKAKVWVWPDEHTNHRCYNGRTRVATHWRCRYGSS